MSTDYLVGFFGFLGLFTFFYVLVVGLSYCIEGFKWVLKYKKEISENPELLEKAEREVR